MKHLLLAGVAFGSLALAAPVAAQQIPFGRVVASCGAESYTAGTQKGQTMDTTGKVCATGGTSDATAANQALQITQETAINTILGTVTASPTSNTIADRLKSLATISYAQGSTTSAQTGYLIQGAVTTSPPSYTTAQTSPLSLDTAGNLRTNCITGCGSVAGYAQASTTSGQLGPLQMSAVTTSAPSYTNATTNAMSVDTHGATRSLIMDASGVAVDFTANTPAAQVNVYPGTNAGGVVTEATPITATSANVANSNAVATLAGTSGKTTYITGFQCTASGATVGADVTLTVAGTITGTMNYTFNFPAGALVAAQPLVVTFGFPVPASATNTAIVVTNPAGGAGNTNSTCAAQGFQK